jgi:hypothetical protein
MKAMGTTTRTGHCICGAVKVTATLPKLEFQACHCVQCQRWTGGGPYLAVLVESVEISGSENIAAYHASSWGERANCAICGSILFWRMQGKDPNSIALGLLDDQSNLRLTKEIFVDQRPDWLTAEASASQSTEAQEIAKLDEFLKDQPK